MKSQLKPVNQKSVYHSYSEIYAKVMNNELDVDRAEVASHCLDGMTRVYALEIKRYEIENMYLDKKNRADLRIIEMKNFDNIPIEENNHKDNFPIDNNNNP